MNILLPKKEFVFYDKEGTLISEIKDKVLYLYRPSMFQKVQYELTYSIYGRVCMYCGKSHATTIDHRIPQDFGGPTITNNLYPTCEKCNSQKSNMYEDEFQEFLTLSGKTEKGLFRRKLKAIQEARRYGLVPSLPDEWLEHELDRPLISMVYSQEPLGSKFRTQSEFFRIYQRAKNPIIYSGNYVLVDGFYTILLFKFQDMFKKDEKDEKEERKIKIDESEIQEECETVETTQINFKSDKIKLDNMKVILDECSK